MPDESLAYLQYRVLDKDRTEIVLSNDKEAGLSSPEKSAKKKLRGTEPDTDTPAAGTLKQQKALPAQEPKPERKPEPKPENKPEKKAASKQPKAEKAESGRQAGKTKTQTPSAPEPTTGNVPEAETSAKNVVATLPPEPTPKLLPPVDDDSEKSAGTVKSPVNIAAPETDESDESATAGDDTAENSEKTESQAKKRRRRRRRKPKAASNDATETPDTPQTEIQSQE